MAVVALPAAMPIRSIKWSLTQPHQVNRSGWTGRRQVLTTPGGALWTCSAELVPIIGQANAKKWRAFFNALEGQLHTFPMTAVEASQHGGANPTVVSGSAGASTVTLSSSPPALVAGDFLSIKLVDGTWQLVILTAPISGTTATFKPQLRNTAATGVGSCESVLPFAHVALRQSAWEYAVDPGQVYTFAFEAEEAF